MKSLAILAALILAISYVEASGLRLKRSVNFTPSWGKRSLGSAGNSNFQNSMQQPMIPSFMGPEESKCASRGLYLQALFDTMRVINTLFLHTVGKMILLAF